MGVETTLIKTVGKYFSKKWRKMVNSMSQPQFTQNWKSKIGNGKITSLSSMAVEIIKETFCHSYAHEIYSP